MMQLSDAGLAAIKRHEGLRLDAYPDPGSSNGLPVTIGYGSTKTLTGKPWQLGDRISEAEAEALLIRDIEDFETAVNRLVTVPLTQAMFDSLVSFSFNVGASAFSGSTLLRKLNAGDYAGAAGQFERWKYNDGRVMPGLVRRRADESAMFASQGLSPAEQAQIADVPRPIPEPIAAPESVFRPDDEPPAPIVESVPTTVNPEPKRGFMSPIIAALFPTLLKQIPDLVRSFGDGHVTERNAAAAEAVVQLVQTATGATNAQAAIEAVMNDPQARSAAIAALAADHWLDVSEVGGGVTAARESASREQPFWHQGVFWVSAMVLPLVYMTVWFVLDGPIEAFSGELRAAVATAVVTGVLSGLSGYWYGLKFSTPKQQAMRPE